MNKQIRQTRTLREGRETTTNSNKPKIKWWCQMRISTVPLSIRATRTWPTAATTQAVATCPPWRVAVAAVAVAGVATNWAPSFPTIPPIQIWPTVNFNSLKYWIKIKINLFFCCKDLNNNFQNQMNNYAALAAAAAAAAAAASSNSSSSSGVAGQQRNMGMNMSSGHITPPNNTASVGGNQTNNLSNALSNSNNNIVLQQNILNQLNVANLANSVASPNRQ